MNLGIDAYNISSGGGLTHLTRFLAAARPEEAGVESVVLFASSRVLERVTPRPWLRTIAPRRLDGRLTARLAWERLDRDREAKEAGCDALFVPGGTARAESDLPLVTMCRNLLPHDDLARGRYGWNDPKRWRLELLRRGQIRGFERADGLIFLTEFAREVIEPRLRRKPPEIAVIPHGVEDRFRCEPRAGRAFADCSPSEPFRLLYVSIIEAYKHQAEVLQAVRALVEEGLYVHIDFAGPANPAVQRAFEAWARQIDPQGECHRVLGAVQFDELHDLYRQAEGFVFASSCENMPNILLEAMAAGLPIACSDRGPMPEVLGEVGCYFDPEDPEVVRGALRTLVRAEPEQRLAWARAASERARAWNWERCAAETLAFVARCARRDR